MSEAITPIYLALPFPPSVNGIWRGGKGGRHFISPNYKAWRQEAALRARLQSKQHISGPYALQVNLVRPDKRKRDLDNHGLKAVSDLLVHCGFITDDSEAQYIELRWCERGPPCWVAIRPCTRWATEIQGERHAENS